MTSQSTQLSITNAHLIIHFKIKNKYDVAIQIHTFIILKNIINLTYLFFEPFASAGCFVIS